MSPWLQQWRDFCFRTPKRTIITLVVVAAIFFVINPQYGEILMSRLLIALTPFIQVALLCAIVWFGLKKLLFGGSGGSKGKKK